jgi:hypothetical protein
LPAQAPTRKTADADAKNPKYGAQRFVAAERPATKLPTPAGTFRRRNDGLISQEIIQFAE